MKLLRDSGIIAEWDEGRWPDTAFFEVMNVPVRRCEIIDNRQIEIELDGGLTIVLEDNSDAYESFTVTIDGKLWII